MKALALHAANPHLVPVTTFISKNYHHHPFNDPGALTKESQFQNLLATVRDKPLGKKKTLRPPSKRECKLSCQPNPSFILIYSYWHSSRLLVRTAYTGAVIPFWETC